MKHSPLTLLSPPITACTPSALVVDESGPSLCYVNTILSNPGENFEDIPGTALYQLSEKILNFTNEQLRGLGELVTDLFGIK